MTAAGIHESPPAPAPASPAFAVAGARLVRLYLVSRRVPAAAGLLAALGCLLWAALHWHWNIAGGPAAQLVIPLVIETGAAGVVAVSSHGPFGEAERATGRWLPWLRLGAALALTAVAFAALAAGATGGYLPGGSLSLLRNLGGMTGTGLLSAAVLGGAFGWVGPMGYLLVIEGGLADGWGTLDLAGPAVGRPGRGAVRVRGLRGRCHRTDAAGHPRYRAAPRVRVAAADGALDALPPVRGDGGLLVTRFSRPRDR